MIDASDVCNAALYGSLPIVESKTLISALMLQR